MAQITKNVTKVQKQIVLKMSVNVDFNNALECYLLSWWPTYSLLHLSRTKVTLDTVGNLLIWQTNDLGDQVWVLLTSILFAYIEEFGWIKEIGT